MADSQHTQNPPAQGTRAPITSFVRAIDGMLLDAPDIETAEGAA